MKPETLFRQRVQRFLRKFPKEIWFTGVQQAAICGTPDILACICGEFYGIELKAECGKLSVLQAYNLAKIKETGGQAIPLWPKHYPQFCEVIEEKVRTYRERKD
jgi:hypothetical protein